MEKYHMITLEEASAISLDQLIQHYNDAIEDIWYLQYRLDRERQENEDLWAAYEELLDKLYG